MNSFYYEKTINHIADQLSNCEDWDVSTDESLSDIFVFHIKNCYPQIKLAIIRNIFEKYTSIPIKDKMELSFDIKKLISANLSEDQVNFSPEFINFLSNLRYLDRDDIHKLINGITSLDSILEHEDYLLVVKADF